MFVKAFAGANKFGTTKLVNTHARFNVNYDIVRADLLISFLVYVCAYIL